MRKAGEVEMKHPEYDSPFVLNLSDITAQMAQNIDGMCLQAVQRVGVNVDEEKLLTALNQDSKRYREAYRSGYETGYEKRDEEIIRCRDCKWNNGYTGCDKYLLPHGGDWYCADAERRDDDG